MNRNHLVSEHKKDRYRDYPQCTINNSDCLILFLIKDSHMIEATMISTIKRCLLLFGGLALLLIGLEVSGMLLLVQPINKGQQTVHRPTPTPTAIALATPTATLKPTIDAMTPTPILKAGSWPQPVADPLSSLMIVNKKYALSATFVPPDLRMVAVAHTNNHPLRDMAAFALEQMVAAAATQNVHLRLLSGYRSYTTQVGLYNNYVASYGVAAADRFSARPGHSEHQSGLALDIGDIDAAQCDIEACFATTAGGKWVAAHVVEFGYIVRYTADKESVTGYMAEPWHLRYVGKDLATKLTSSRLSMEEYLGVTGGDY
jgi:D-alanyl-D-alanine carboxypeptidase